MAFISKNGPASKRMTGLPANFHVLHGSTKVSARCRSKLTSLLGTNYPPQLRLPFVNHSDFWKDSAPCWSLIYSAGGGGAASRLHWSFCSKISLQLTAKLKKLQKQQQNKLSQTLYSTAVVGFCSQDKFVALLTSEGNHANPHVTFIFSRSAVLHYQSEPDRY